MLKTKMTYYHSILVDVGFDCDHYVIRSLYDLPAIEQWCCLESTWSESTNSHMVFATVAAVLFQA